MKRKPILTLFLATVLVTLLAALAFAVTHVKQNARGAIQWQSGSGQTLNELGWLPQSRWGFGSIPSVLTTASGAPVMLTTATGRPITGDSTTKCGFFAVYRYNLTAWHYDAKTGFVSYDCN